MKQGGGRLKGNAFERATAKMIIKAFACFGVTGQDCYRTPSSGGHRFAKKLDPGDLVFSELLTGLFPASVECKFYKRLDWHLLMSDKQGEWRAWWEQCCEAASVTQCPVVVFHQNHGDVYAMYRILHEDKLCNGNGFALNVLYLKARIGHSRVKIVRFSDLLKASVCGAKQIRKAKRKATA